MRWMYAVLGAYIVGFLLFPPRALLVIDEHSYVAQAMAFADFRLNLPDADPLIPANPLRVASNYPPGTSLLQAPLVAIAGWRGAAGLSVLAVVVATLVTARWLRERGRSPMFAVLVPWFAGTLFFGRLAMSDMPSAAWAALALWLVFRADRRVGRSFAAGIVASCGLLLRETNAVLIAPFVIGAVIRKHTSTPALMAGVAVGAAARLVIALWLFGDPFYVRPSGYGFSFASIPENLAVYAVILCILVPVGALLPFLYRGERKEEMITAFVAYVAVYVCYDYVPMRENGVARGFLLATRFALPLLPMLAFMAAEVFPRIIGGRAVVARVSSRLAPVVLAALVAASFAVHPVIHRLEAVPLAVVQRLQQVTSPDVPVITNHSVTLKYFSPAYGARRLMLRSYIRPDEVPAVLREHGAVSIVLLDRLEGDLFRRDAQENAAFIDAVRAHCRTTITGDEEVAGMRLRSYTVAECRS